MEAYLQEVQERQALNIPPKPLTKEFCGTVCDLLTTDAATPEILSLLVDRVSPGVDPAAQVKAVFLGEIARGVKQCSLITAQRAIELLGTMSGGYNIQVLTDLLKSGPEGLISELVKAFRSLFMIYDHEFRALVEISEGPQGDSRTEAALTILRSWANAEWLASTPAAPQEYRVKVVKVSGETTTDDLSPPGDAVTRPDIPLHALSMGVKAFPTELARIREYAAECRARQEPQGAEYVAFVGDVVGTGSSRKSAANSLVWEIGQDIPFVPNRRFAGVCLGGKVAPIFYETMRDCGAIVLKGVDVSQLNTGDVITIDLASCSIKNAQGEVLTTFPAPVPSLLAEHRIGGRLLLFMGMQLTTRARAYLTQKHGLTGTLREAVPDAQLQPCFEEHILLAEGHGYTRAQKIVGKACGLPGVLPGSAVAPHMTTVASQDTTGPMTADEIAGLACTAFNADLVMQSFCHTCAYPTPTDVRMHKTLPKFFTERGGIALRPGDGVVHSWINRMLLPDTVGTGGDSHTRFPLGISFPAGSGMVACAAAVGAMPINLPPSVRVQFRGALKPGITIRDLVNAITYSAIQQGKLTVPKLNKINVFDGTIIEIDGLPDLSVEQAFELTNATAERSAAAACIDISEESVVRYVKSCASLLESLKRDGYQHADALQRRVDAMKAWARNPQLVHADANAVYKDTVVVDLDQITEPIVACPNDPDDVRLLSQVAGTKIEDVFVGSCMTNIGHFRAAERIWKAAPGVVNRKDTRVWLCPPTRMDQQTLREEAWFATTKKVGARVEMPGCSLCMGNQARVPDDAVVFSTSTRNFRNRVGNGCQVYLGSAELASIVAFKGCIPTPEEYFELYNMCVAPHSADVYRYNYFHEMEGYPQW